MDRSARTAVSVTLVVLSIFMIANQIVDNTPLEERWLAGLLLLIAAALGITDWLSSRAAQSAALPESAPAYPSFEVAEPARAAAPGTHDDLLIIEGIGPKFNEALLRAGITTFARLARASEKELHAAIEAAGMRFAPSIPTWSEQADYAARGDWDGLKAYQERLTAGRPPKK
jgi:predicted flap endonuclease-1-like 5' DNA nuclease